ncbi:RNA polymerase sigma-70 factor, ECF subfamily [Chitinophaga niabensis]|uniref:RNA polymerase sigma-70 factor, ECF subfamily n=1 Tax=Chitinophaga niabensis TaxID=536979 RepID=A0A1N6GCP0_9BACT|nr:RNA polymerase sigma-70 factor, ECF subfamily [Chitinophaga niabensis]
MEIKPSTKEQEQLLLQQLAAGSERAFTAMYHAHKQHIFDVALLYTKNADQAEEIVQEVFHKIWEKRETLADVLEFKNFLFIIARNCIFNQFKKSSQELAAQKDLFLTQTETVDDTDYRLRNEQCEELLHTAVASLPPQRKRIYQLAKEGGLSYEEIASQLSISRFTVKNQMAEALRFIRVQLHKHLHTLLAFSILICQLFR